MLAGTSSWVYKGDTKDYPGSHSQESFSLQKEVCILNYVREIGHYKLFGGSIEVWLGLREVEGAP